MREFHLFLACLFNFGHAYLEVAEKRALSRFLLATSPAGGAREAIQWNSGSAGEPFGRSDSVMTRPHGRVLQSRSGSRQYDRPPRVHPDAAIEWNSGSAGEPFGQSDSVVKRSMASGRPYRSRAREGNYDRPPRVEGNEPIHWNSGSAGEPFGRSDSVMTRPHGRPLRTRPLDRNYHVRPPSDGEAFGRSDPMMTRSRGGPMRRPSQSGRDMSIQWNSGSAGEPFGQSDSVWTRPHGRPLHSRARNEELEELYDPPPYDAPPDAPGTKEYDNMFVRPWGALGESSRYNEESARYDRPWAGLGVDGRSRRGHGRSTRRSHWRDQGTKWAGMEIPPPRRD